jgi:hypothetical protein
MDTSVAFHKSAANIANDSSYHTINLWRCQILISPYNHITLYNKISGLSYVSCVILIYV